MSDSATSPSLPGAPSRTGRARARRRGDAAFGWALVSPVLLGWAALVAWPIVQAALNSLHSTNLFTGQSSWVGLGNYTRMLQDEGARGVLVATVTFSLGLVILNISLALALAVLLNTRLPGRTAFRTLFFSPMVVSLVAWALVWGMLLRKDGAVNALLASIGVTGPNWLREETSAMVAVIVVQTLKGVGLNMVLFLAALQAIPGELKEAASLDGARRTTTFWRIELPLIAPTLFLAVLITALGSLQVFATISVLTSGGPGGATDVLAYYIYRQGFERHDLGYASALAMALFAVVLVMTSVQWRLRRRWVHDEV